jgi:hypothetical protein
MNMRCKTCRKTRGKIRGGGCGCGNNLNLFGQKIGGSAGLAQLPIRNYYQFNPMNNDPFAAQQSERTLMGGKRNKRHTRGGKNKQKGGTLNATEIMNKFGDSVSTPFSTGILFGSPYTDPTVTNQPIDIRYGPSNPYIV